MSSHFTQFTPTAMRAFGSALAEGRRARTQLISEARDHTLAMLAGFRKEHLELEHARRQRAERDADTRRIFASELRAGVHALKSRFALNRSEVAGDLRAMAHEYRAAATAFRTPAAAAAPRSPAPQARPAQPPPQARPAQPPPQARPAATDDPSAKKATT